VPIQNTNRLGNVGAGRSVSVGPSSDSSGSVGIVRMIDSDRDDYDRHAFTLLPQENDDGRPQPR
jgi:hypothetical protein